MSLATVAVLALLLNSRHIFYGLSFIDKFRSFGPWRWFLIYSLCDENYSLHCSHDFGPDVNEKWAYVLTAALVTFYWVALSMLGIDPSMQYIIKGGIILAACSLDMRKYLAKK